MPRTRTRQGTAPTLLVAGTVLVGGAAAAQPANPPETAVGEAPVEQVLVTISGAERRVFDSPQAASVVSAETLRAAGPMVNLSEALSRVPGLVVANRHNLAQDLQISSRGFGARASFGVRGIRLVADGVPASGPDGQGQVSHFDLAGAERIEVLRGPFSALQGSSSGGVITVHTAAPRERRMELGSDLGSFGLVQSRLLLESPLQAGWSLRAQLSHLELEGFRPQSAAARTLGHLRLGWSGARDRVVLTLGHIDQPADDPLGLTRPQWQDNPLQTAIQAVPQATPGEADRFDTRKTVRQDQAGLQWRHRVEGAGPLAETLFSAYRGRRAVRQWQAIPVATQFNAANPSLTERHPGGVIDFERDYQGADGRLVLRWALPGRGGLQVVAGLATDQTAEDRRGFENFTGSGAMQRLGVTGRLRRDERNRVRADARYVEAELELDAGWLLQFGQREGRLAFDSRDRYVVGRNGDDSGRLAFRQRSPVAALQWRPDPRWRVHLGFGRGFESPTLAELAYRPDGEPGLNAGLRPQTSRQWELGGKWRPDGTGLALDVTVFSASTADEIGVASNAGGRSTFRNVGRTRRQGAEVELKWQLSAAWRAEGAWTVLDARHLDAFVACRGVPCVQAGELVPAGRRIAGTQPRSAYAELAWQASPRLSAAVEFWAQGRVAVNDLNADFAPGHALLAMRAQARWPLGKGHLEALARVDNVTDRCVAGSVIVNEANGRFFEPAPGRAWGLTARWSRVF